MTKDPVRDAELKRNIEANEALKSKYERVKNSISSHGLNYQKSLQMTDNFITRAQTAIDKVNGNEGYSYLETFKTKLTDDVTDMTEYRDFVRDANTSFVNLYDLLESKISSLNASIIRDKKEYNEGHDGWEFFTDRYWLAPWE